MKIINKSFLIPFSVIWVVIFVFRLFQEKGEFLASIGMNHTESWNVFFMISTQFAEELAYLAFAVVFLFIRYRASLSVAFTGIAVTVVAAILKRIFAFERPFLYFRNRGIESQYSIIEGIEPYSGLTSFPSGHAMAGFALMSLLSLYIRNSYLAMVFLLVAILVGFSRIYLGHHFIEDVLFGSVMGVLVSHLIYALMEKWKTPILDQSFLSSRKTHLNA